MSIWISSVFLLTRLCTFCVSLRYCVCVNHAYTFSATLLFQIPFTSASSILSIHLLGFCHGTSMAWYAPWCFISICRCGCSPIYRKQLESREIRDTWWKLHYIYEWCWSHQHFFSIKELNSCFLVPLLKSYLGHLVLPTARTSSLI
jgi:hypothetical protein